MDCISRFVIWICSKFDRDQILRIIQELQDATIQCPSIALDTQILSRQGQNIYRTI